MKILIAAGGSGGHIFPAVALARTLKDKGSDTDIKFVGSDKGLDKRIFEKEDFKFSLLSANKMPYRMTFGILLFCIKLAFDIVKALWIVISYGPDVVVGFGGYVSGPVIFVSYLLGIPRIAHEQNVVPGRANRLIFKMADKIAISFKETIAFLGPEAKKAFYTGNPIRTDVFKNDKRGGVERLGLDSRKFTILVIGGSQGAHFLNETFVNALSELDEKIRESLQVIHITGLKDYEWAQNFYKDLNLEHRVYSFIDKIEEAYSASDLVITRSGASAVFEIAFFGRPMILIPYPFAMSHQAENAKVFSEKGAAITIDEKDLSAKLFKDNIASLLNDRNRLNEMAKSAASLSIPEASDRLAEQILNLA